VKRPRLPASNADLALWLAVLALGFPVALFLLFALGASCDNGRCENPAPLVAVIGATGFVAAIGSLWAARPRPWLIAGLVLLAAAVLRAARALGG